MRRSASFVIAPRVRPISAARRLGAMGANILEVEHRRQLLDVPAKGASLDVMIETRDAAHAREVIAAMAADGYKPVRLGTGPL